ncbi:MAG: hypothetical protein KAI08_15090, partial [Bacteroidales bacterium]|nr:hypothetical protein [Bacteroidales bacterium]
QTFPILAGAKAEEGYPYNYCICSCDIVILEALDITGRKDGGADISAVNDVEFLKTENGNAVFTVGSGFHSFEPTLK